MSGSGVRFLSFDPGDMDTPLHALAVPDADPATLKRPADSAAELIVTIEQALDELRSTRPDPCETRGAAIEAIVP